MKRFVVTVASLALLATGVGVTTTAHTAPVAVTAKKAAKKPTVTLTANKDMVKKGKKIKLKGTINPKKGTKGDVVIIKQRIGNKKWKTEGRTTVNKKGKFKYTDKPSTANTRHYKAVLKKTKKHAKAASPKTKVAVTQWMTIDDLRKQIAGYHKMRPQKGKVDAKAYAGSIMSERRRTVPYDSWLEVNLYKSCFKLRTQAALSDASASGAEARVAIVNDGESVHETVLTDLFTVTPVPTISLDGVNRIRFEASVKSAKAAAGYLSPEFLCTT